MGIRPYRPSDWPALWPTIEDIVWRGDTFSYDPALTEDEARRMWVVDSPGRVTVAIDEDDAVGTANMYANRPGPGSHVASGTVMVAADARGRGVGRALLTDLLRWALRTGFDGVQFNAVAASNTAAVGLYHRLGFITIGTVPGAFAHPERGKVGLHVMFHDLSKVPDVEGDVRRVVDTQSRGAPRGDRRAGTSASAVVLDATCPLQAGGRCVRPRRADVGALSRPSGGVHCPGPHHHRGPP